MNRIYVAGPMTGLPDNGYPAFHAAAFALRAHGYEVENPAENPAPPCGSWLGYMRMAVAQVAKADAVVLLPGWEASKGASVEQCLAAGMGLPCIRWGGAHWICSRMEGEYAALPIGHGINQHEAYAAWRHLAKLAGGIL